MNWLGASGGEASESAAMEGTAERKDRQIWTARGLIEHRSVQLVLGGCSTTTLILHILDENGFEGIFIGS